MRKSLTFIPMLAGTVCATSALATEALTSANVRSGPGASYSVVDTLRAGEEVDVVGCRSNGWCSIEHSGPDGWVSARLLSADEDADIVVDDDLGVRPRPNVDFSFSFGGRGIGIGNGPPLMRDRELVCLVTFFRRDQVEAGADADVRSARLLPRWQAEQLDRPNDRRGIWDYGSNQQTRDTCRYLDNLDN